MLDKHGVAYDFHDFTTAGVTKALLAKWCAAAGWEKVTGEPPIKRLKVKS